MSTETIEKENPTPEFKNPYEIKPAAPEFQYVADALNRLTAVFTKSLIEEAEANGKFDVMFLSMGCTTMALRELERVAAISLPEEQLMSYIKDTEKLGEDLIHYTRETHTGDLPDVGIAMGLLRASLGYFSAVIDASHRLKQQEQEGTQALPEVFETFISEQELEEVKDTE